MKDKKLFRGPLIYVVIILMIILIISMVGRPTDEIAKKERGYSEFMQMVKDGEISAIQITANELTALAKDSALKPEDMPKDYDYAVYVPSIFQFQQDLLEVTGKSDLTQLNMSIDYNPQPETSFWIQLLPYIILGVLLIAFWVWMMRQAQNGGGGNAMKFAKSKAHMSLQNDKNRKTFADVAGADEEKEELKEIVDFLKEPKKFAVLGARIPKGVLLVGPPGGGKTLLAKAVAGEAGVPFFSISGSDFVEMFVGVGASRVRDLFDTAKKNAPCIIFIDEIDAVGRQRGAGLGGGHDEREQTLNQLLVEMDGFQVNEGIIVIAATNRKDILDPALLRPGRFDRQIVVSYPDVKGREAILRVHAKNKPLSKEVDLATLAKMTPGFIGADLENVLNEAAILAARRSRKDIGMNEVEEAIKRVIAGPEKKSRVVTEKDKRCTAYHEVGHAILAKVLPNCDPVHEVSIVPRGMAAGYTLTLPDNDDRHMFKSKMLDEICMRLGGRVAEKLVLGDVSTGASNDIQRATELAKSMVVTYGMSEEIGPIYLGGDQEVFLGRDFGHTRDFSEQLGAKIDKEIHKILSDAFTKAENIIQENMDKMHLIADVLTERESITGEEFQNLFETGSLTGRVVIDPKEKEESLELEAEEQQHQSAEEAEAEGNAADKPEEQEKPKGEEPKEES